MKKGIFIILLHLFSYATAQTIKLTSGSLQGLKSQTSYNIKFTYDSLMVGTDMPERIYLDEKRTQWERKEPGRGFDFVKFWFDDRKETYEPTFIYNIEKYAKIKLNDIDANYILLVKTKRIEGGWTVGVMNHPAEIDGELWIVDTMDNSKVVARIGFYNIAGNKFFGGDFEMATRIQSAYMFAGKGLGYYLKRKAK